MENHPLVTVVIPCFNAEQFVGDAIASVRAQRYPRWELIVVDDGSHDRTLAEAQQQALRDERVCVLTQPNAGVVAARNAGLAAANPSSSYLLFLDADDVLHPLALDLLLEAQQQSPTAVGAHGLARVVDEQGVAQPASPSEAWTRRRHVVRDGRLAPWPVDQPTTFEVLAVDNCIQSPGCALLRRDLVARLGGFALGPAHTTHDYDLWLRLTAHGEMAFVDQVVLDYRVHGLSMSANAHRNEWSRRYTVERLLASNELSPAHQRILRESQRLRLLLLHQSRVRWALESARRGQVTPALRQTAHALRDLAAFLAITLRARASRAPGQHAA